MMLINGLLKFFQKTSTIKSTHFLNPKVKNGDKRNGKEIQNKLG